MSKFNKVALLSLALLGPQRMREQEIRPEENAPVLKELKKEVHTSLERAQDENFSAEEVRSQREKTLRLNQENNTEEGFWRTASILEENLNKRGLPFVLSSFGEDNIAVLSWKMDEATQIAITLPNPEHIDLAYHYNIAFQEMELNEEEGIKKLRNKLFLKSNDVNILLDKIDEELGRPKYNEPLTDLPSEVQLEE